MQRNFGSRLKNWLKPVTRKHLATSKASTRAIPKRQERSRRTDILTLLVLREKEVRYCLREGQPAVCHQCVEVYQKVRQGQPHESTKSSGEASDHKLKIYRIIDTEPSRRIDTLDHTYIMYAC